MPVVYGTLIKDWMGKEAGTVIQVLDKKYEALVAQGVMAEKDPVEEAAKKKPKKKKEVAQDVEPKDLNND